jgi:predicted secreted protein
MRISALLAALFVVGLVVSLALASPTKKPKPQATNTTTASKPKCDQVELKGNATAGSVTFTVTKANKRGRSLVGTAVTLVIPADAKVKAKACSAAGGALTLRNLHVKVSPAKP